MGKPDQPSDGNYTAKQCHTNYLKIQNKVLDQMCMAFMVHLLPPKLRSEVIQKKPRSMAQSSKFAQETQCILRDKTRPLGSQMNPKPRVLAIHEEEC